MPSLIGFRGVRRSVICNSQCDERDEIIQRANICVWPLPELRRVLMNHHACDLKKLSLLNYSNCDLQSLCPVVCIPLSLLTKNYSVNITVDDFGSSFGVNISVRWWKYLHMLWSTHSNNLHFIAAFRRSSSVLIYSHYCCNIGYAFILDG